AGVLGRVVSGFLSSRLWYPVTQLSYSAYLLHPIVLARFYGLVAAYGGLSVPEGVFYVVGPAICLAAASALYLFVESPFMPLPDAHPRVVHGSHQSASADAEGPEGSRPPQTRGPSGRATIGDETEARTRS